MKTFDLIKQYKIFEKDINKRVLRVLSSGSYILGQNVKSFENNARKYLATRYTVSCNSGTDALVMSLRALDISSNDEVITTPFTYFATSEAISLVGAIPIFADINPHTFNINPKKIEKLISNMGVAKPTIMTAVPRFYQNLFTKINMNFDKQKGLKKK